MNKIIILILLTALILGCTAQTSGGNNTSFNASNVNVSESGLNDLEAELGNMSFDDLGGLTD